MQFSEVTAEFAKEASQISKDYKKAVVQMNRHHEKVSSNVQSLAVLREQSWGSDMTQHFDAIEAAITKERQHDQQLNDDLDAAKATLKKRLATCKESMKFLLQSFQEMESSIKYTTWSCRSTEEVSPSREDTLEESTPYPFKGADSVTPVSRDKDGHLNLNAGSVQALIPEMNAYPRTQLVDDVVEVCEESVPSHELRADVWKSTSPVDVSMNAEERLQKLDGFV